MFGKKRKQQFKDNLLEWLRKEEQYLESEIKRMPAFQSEMEARITQVVKTRHVVSSEQFDF